MSHLEPAGIREFSPGKTALLVAGIAVGVAVSLVVVAVAVGGDGDGGSSSHHIDFD